MAAAPNQLVIAELSAEFPGRAAQIRSLGTLLGGAVPIPRNLVLYGLEATGKSAITKSLLHALSAETLDDTKRQRINYAIVKSAECITARHLLENTVAAVAQAAGGVDSPPARCENLAQLAVDLEKLLQPQANGGQRDSFVLVFDGIDRQRDAPPTLISGLARLAEMVPNLTSIFIVTAPRPHMLHQTGVMHVQFPQYSKPEALQILALEVPLIHHYADEDEPGLLTPDEVDTEVRERRELWTRFCSTVWDALSKHSDRDILSLRAVCLNLWPDFVEPVREGHVKASAITQLLVSQRFIFQDESVLVPSIVSKPPAPISASSTLAKADKIASQLPYISRFLLIAAYVASYNPTRADLVFFSHSSERRKARRKRKNQNAAAAAAAAAIASSEGGAGGTARRKGGGGGGGGSGGAKARKTPRTLLGPASFVLERMLAIFHALLADAGRGALPGRRAGGSTADVQGGLATLGSLRLLVKTSGAADALDGTTKWRVNVGWDMVRGVARSVGVEMEELVWD